MKKELQSNVNGMTSGGGSIQHPLSIHSASIGSRWKVGGIQVLLTLVILFTFSVGQMWGTNTELVDGATLPDLPTATLDVGAQTADANGYVIYQPYNSEVRNGSKAWSSENSGGSGSLNIGAHAPFVASNTTHCKVRSTARTYAVQFTGATDVLIHGKAGSGQTLYLDVYQVIAGVIQTTRIDRQSCTNAEAALTVSDLTYTNTYVAYVYYTTTSDGGWLAGVAFKQPENVDGPFAVTYDKNDEGASGTMTDGSSPYEKNSTVTVLTNSFTAPTGKVFKEWNTKANGTGVSYDPGDTFTAIKDVKLYAQWAYPATGTGTITYTLTANKNEVSAAVNGVSTLSSTLTAFTLSTLTCGSGNSKDGYSGQIQNHAADYSASQYVALQFTVADGYIFTPSSVAMTVFANSTSNMKMKVKLTDGTVSVESNELTCSSSADSDISFASGAFTGKKFTGNVDVIVYQWGVTSKRTYIKSPVTITGTMAVDVPAATHTLAWDFAGGSTTSTTHTAAGQVAEGATITYPAANTMSKSGFAFTGWSTDVTTMPTSDLTITAQWAQTYAVIYVPNNGVLPAETMTDNNAPYKAGDEVTLLANTFTAPENKEFDAWVVTPTAGGDPITVTAGKFTMPAAAVTVTATWKDACALAPTVSATTLGTTSYTTQVVNCAGISVLGSAGCTISEYGFVYGTATAPTISDNKKALEGDYTVAGTAFPATTLTGLAMDTKYYVRAYATNSYGTAYGDEVNFTTLESLGNVLVVASSASQTSDAITALRDNGFVVTVSAHANSRDYTGYDLVVLDESLNGGDAQTAANEESKIKDVNIPILNLKAFFYTKTNRWNWGTPVNGTSGNEIANISEAYCNAQDHPIFAGLTINEGAIDLIDPAKSGNTLQGVTTNTLAEGKVGYTLATSGTGITFIHELTPSQRGVDAKYLMIAISNNAKDNLSADGEKLIVNAAKYLVGSTPWTPITVPTSPEVTATPSENYTEGNTITLTASATGTSASTTYTWYKGADWATASAAPAVQAAATAAADGNVFTKTAAVEDAGTYWCNISNGTGCDVQASVTITVSSASTPTHAISYDNLKGVDVSAYPTEYTEGVGVASFDPLADITGWHFVEWSPASIGTDADEDVTITAVWAQVFEVTFNLQGHGAAIDAQDIVDGSKATEPDAPSAIGYDFGGWYTDAECTAGNEFDFNSTISEDKELFAKWTAFDGCTLLYPATSGDAIAIGDEINMQSGSFGATMVAVVKSGETASTLAYSQYGLAFNTNGDKARVKVTLGNDIAVGTKISVTIKANGNNTNARGLDLYNAAVGNKKFLGWAASTYENGDVATFTYTAEASDGYVGTNEFYLYRSNSVYLECLKVEACGSSVIFHDLTSAVDPTGKGVVTLGASSVREGYTTTATYSDIDAAYEFDEWQISGTGASIADASANPAVITMGTADAVVTLKLKTATPKHTVTFNKMGKGDDIAPALVAEGAKVTEPTVTEPEGWMLEGWYKESTLENKWDFATDVMGNTNIELFANWVADTSIKLFSNTGVLNTTNFVSAAASTIEIDAVEHVCLAQFASNRSSLAGTVPADMVQYNATTNAAKIQITFYNTNSSAKRAYLYRVKEGDTEATPLEISVPGQEIWTTEYYTFNGEENRSFYVTAGDRSNIRILQVRVVDNGTAIKQAGQAGYSLNFNKGRLYVKNGVETSFEGMTINASSEYKVFNNSNIATNSNFSFTTTVDKMVLKVTRSGGNYYVSQDPASKGTIYNNNQEIVLTPAGTWYIGSETNGSAASFSKIEFIAPKCAEPAFNSLANSDICSGDPYVALNGTATVADAGVPTYKWYAEGADESDPAAVLGTGATYTPEADGNYYVIATNHLAGYTDNTKKSDLVTVTTHAGTTITGYTNANGAAGATGKQISVTAEGVGTLHYVWYTCDDELGSNPVALPENDAATLSGITIPSGIQYYKVVVTSTCGSAEQILFAKEWVDVELQDVTGSMIWNWHKTQNPDAWMGIDGDITVASTSVLANVNYGQIPNVTNFHSAMLKVVVSTVETKIRKGTDNGVIQGNEIMFHTTVPGIVIVTYRGTGNSANVTLTIGSETLPTYAGSMTTSKKVFVPAGDVVISSGSDAFRIQKIQFIAEADYPRNVTQGRYGTICLPKAGVMVGADLYEVAYYGATSKKIFFDEILGGVMEAGVPYIFLPKEGVSTLGVFYTSDDVVPAGTYYTDGTTPASTSKNGLVGFIGANEDAETSVPEGMYILQNNQYREVLAGADARIKSYRAYINLGAITPTAPALAPGRRRISMGVASENSATGMDELNASETPVKMMIDGQLYILRGEKLYDATGRLVK